MQCPKCQSPFEEVEVGQVTVQRCTRCRGLWLDRKKHEYLKTVDGSEEIDIGDPIIGRDFNEIDQYLCPECSTAMIRMVVPDQHHIWYESCSSCAGVFFDAGEFSDYKEKTILDYLRDFMTKERP